MKYLYREKCDTVNQLFLWQVVVVFKITVVIKESCLLINAEIHLLPWEETGKLVFVKCERLYTGEMWKLLILFPCLVK